MRIELNGEPRELAGAPTLADAVRASGADDEARGVAVALDGEVVPRGEWDATALREGQSVEVLAAIQGGSPELDAGTWELGGRERSSRLIAGTGGFRSLEQMEAALAAASRRWNVRPAASVDQGSWRRIDVSSEQGHGFGPELRTGPRA